MWQEEQMGNYVHFVEAIDYYTNFGEFRGWNANNFFF